MDKPARRPRSSFGARLERLSHVRMAYFQRKSRELVNLDSCDLIRSQFGSIVPPRNRTACNQAARWVLRLRQKAKSSAGARSHSVPGSGTGPPPGPPPPPGKPPLPVIYPLAQSAEDI